MVSFKIKYSNQAFMSGRVTFVNEFVEIYVENLTHVKREWLVEKLKKSNLSIDGIPFHIYSES